MIEFKGKKVLLLGLGLHGGGVSTARWLRKHGAELVISDLKDAKVLAPSLAKLKRWSDIQFVLGEHREKDIKWADIIIQNPGIPSNSPYIQLAQKLGKPIYNEASLFFDRMKTQVIGITGTRGKSTTTSLIGAFLQAKDKGVVIAGNIRTTAMLDVVDKIKKPPAVVLELSSWQLEGLAPIKAAPQVAVVTNLYPDHLNRYPSLEDYYNSKKAIFRYQGNSDWLILNWRDEVVRAWASEAPGKVMFFSRADYKRDGVFVRGQDIVFRQNSQEEAILKLDDIKLKGEHNLENVLAAVSVAKLFGVANNIIKKVLHHPPLLGGRQEIIQRKGGVTFVNDTTATTPVAAMAALESFSDKKKNILLIAGGADKNLDYADWGTTVKKYCHEVWLLEGEASDKMEQALAGFKNLHTDYYSLKAAVKEAFDLSARGDVILFSPGAASFNLWQHEFERGDDFNKAVKRLAKL